MQVLGTLCVSYCMAFEANFRAVITNISGNEVEVLYIDYGNYETVQRNQLKSIDDQVYWSTIIYSYFIAR